MILHMLNTLWTGISETNVNIITSATRPHAFNNNISESTRQIFIKLVLLERQCDKDSKFETITISSVGLENATIEFRVQQLIC